MKRLRPGPALLLETALSLPLAALPPILASWDGEGRLLGLSVTIAWYLSPALSPALAGFAAFHGVNPMLACLPPGVCYTLAWLCMRLFPPPAPLACMFLLSTFGACAGLELKRCKEGEHRARKRRK